LRVVHSIELLVALIAAAIGGAVNAIAGGGTLLTFPAIVGLGLSPLVANATSTVALWPGAAGSLWGYRTELSDARGWALRFAIPSLAGGALGAWLLLHTPPDRFARLVPFLVLGATLLFLVQGPIMRRVSERGKPRDGGSGLPIRVPPGAFYVCQFAIGVYGGYFGAGIGILMLAVLGFMGLTNIHQMNGLKNWGALCMNLVAAAMFVVGGVVDWPVAGALAIGGLVGGYGGSRLAQRVGQQSVRRAIVAIGFAAFVWLLLRPK
jgi:uncharacterized membrane protein YfcA